MGWVMTPSGGMHLYYCGDSQRNGSLPEQGLDFRGQGGYVVAAPSQVDGRRYFVASPWSAEPVGIDFGRLREHLAPRLGPVVRPSSERETNTGHLADWVAGQ